MTLTRTFLRSPILESERPQHRLQTELDDVEFQHAAMESLVNMEDDYFRIVREQMTAVHLSRRDGDDDILTEGRSDFLKSAKNMFEKLIEKLKAMYGRAVMYIQAYIGDFEKFVTKYSDQLSKADPQFTIQGYKYEFKPNVPNLNPIQDLVNDYNSDISRLARLTPEEVRRDRDDFTSDEFFSKLRGDVLGVGRSINRDEFVSKVNEELRQGATQPITIDVNRAYLNTVLTEFSDFKKLLASTSVQKDKTMIVLENLKGFFKAGLTTHHSDGKKAAYAHEIEIDDNGHSLKNVEKTDVPSSAKTDQVLDMYFNYRFKQAKELSIIAVTVLNQKLTILKEAVKSHQTIIRRSVFAKTDKEEK